MIRGAYTVGPSIERYLREQIRSVVLAMEVFVVELGAVDGFAASALRKSEPSLGKRRSNGKQDQEAMQDCRPVAHNYWEKRVVYIHPQQ